MKRAVGRGLCAATFLGLALLAAAPDAAAHTGGSALHNLTHPHHLNNPRIITSPASGDTYLPGETITVYVPWGRTLSGTCIQIHTVGTVELEMTVGGVTRTLTGRYENRRNRYGSGFDGTWLYFDYVVQKGDRDTDGVSLPEDALSSPGTTGSSIRGVACGDFSTFELSTDLHGFANQSGHKVDTPAPTFTGVTAPAVLFYAGASVSYRLPQVANADAAHNVSYSVTSARPLPTGYTLNASTATITGSYGSAWARQNYTLRATDGFNRTTDLTFSLEVSADAGIESISITSNPGADNTYGKVAPFGTNDTITVRVDFTHRLTTILGSRVCLNIRIGSNTPRVCNPSTYTSDSSRWDKLDFSYAVQAGDWDGDGISFLTNPMGAGKDGGLRFRITGVGTDNRVNRSFASIPDDANHKVRGQQTTPSFGSTASPAYSWVKGNAVSQALPAATGGDGGVTYSIEESLPAGLSFAAATRTISGTPTAAQAAANYTLAATDADGDKATLRFSLEIQEITVSIDSPSVTEGDSGSTDLTFTATLSKAGTEQVTVDYADAGTGTATSGTDYTAITGGTLTFAAGTTSQTFDVSVTGDTTDEVDETILVTLSDASGAAISTATGTGTITDDDDPPTVSVAAASVTEGDSGSTNLTFTATLSAASGKQVTVAWAEGTGGTATSGTDYTAIAGGTLTFAAGTTSQTFNVSVTGDVVDESNETVAVTLSGPTNATLSSTAASATGTITDDDATPTSITLTVNDDSVGEGDGDTTITVTATVDGTTRFGVDKTVSVSVAGSGTASAVDFAAVTDFDITIAAGAASKSETFTLSPTDDSVDETDETITVSGTSTGLTINSDTITLSDDDDTPSITLSVSDSSVAEDDGATTITVTATVDGATRFVDDTTVAVSVAGSGTAAAVDFAAVSNFNISIGAGEASGTETFTLTPTDDTVHEANETITVGGTSGALTVNSATITLTDDEALPTVALALSPTSIGEAGGASTVTATLSAVSSAAVTLTVAAAAGTGAVAADFSLSAAKTLTIAAGATTSTGTVTVTAADNDVDAANKSVTVSATATGGNGVAAPSDVTLTLTDDDTAGVTFSPTTLTVTEQGASQSFTVVLDSEPTGGTNGTTWVGLTPSDTDELDLNSALTYPYNLSFTTSNWDTAQTVAVTALGDSDRANDSKQIRYTVDGYTGGEVTNQLAVTVTVIDDDKPIVSLSLSSSSISENGGVATVTATLDEAATVATTVTVAAAAGTDTDASDFTPSSANTLTIAAGDTTSTGTVTITAVDNALDEPNKSVTVSGTVSHDGVATPAGKTLTITDDDPAPMLSIDSPSVTEGDSGSRNLTFTATLSAASGRQVTVQYADAGTGTATSGTDYTAIAGGTLTFAAGTTSQTFNVSVMGDVLDEADETVKVRLKDPVNAAVSTTAGTGTGTITDDDATPTLSISSPSVAEGDSGSTSLTYTVTLSAASGRQATVRYADAGTGTATSGTDYTAITGGTLTFAAGTTSRTLSVLVTGDTVNESNETVVVTWSNAANATISSRSGVVATALRVTGTITDDDGAPSTITLTVDDDDVGEGDGATTITVTATVDGTTRFAEAKTVSVSVSQSGMSGNVVDFAAVSNFNIEIAAGAASGTGTFTLTPTDDTEDELDETITVSGTSTGLTVNPDTISLTDDDGTPTSITLTVDDNSVGEGDGATTITVTATLDGSTTLGSATTVRVSVAGGGAATAVDFDTVSAFDIAIAAGDASGTANFTLTPTNDAVDETDETITVRGTSTGLTVNSATISLTDNDAAPTAITLTVSDGSVGEGDGATSITVTATVDGTTRFAEAKTVRVSVAGSGAAGAVDFAAVEAFDIEIAAGAASDTAGFTLTPTDDAVDETDETITVGGTSSGLTVNAATITLTDDDGAPTAITLTVDDGSVGEGDGAATITVTATVDGTMRFAGDTTVTVSVAGSGTATAVDFAAVSSFDITIPAGAASKTGSFTLTPTNDAVDETDETVTVSGMSGSLTVNAATIALTDNDAAPTAITLTVSDNSVSEGDGATAITVTATVDGTTRFAAATTVSVLVRSDSGTMNAVDFASVPGFDIEIAAGDASGTETFTLTPTNDAVDENNETITVYGASGGLTVSPATITLTDDDATPTAITLTVDDGSVAEDDGATTITVTATVDGGTRFATATTVTVRVAGSGAAGAVDFAAVSDFDIEIDAGDASGTGTFTLTPTNDAFDETDETITVSGTSGGLTVNSATITLTDDDDAPTAINLTVDDNSVAEDDGATTITVTATVDGASRFVDATTVTVSVAGGGTATAVDFAAVSDFDITIAAGEAIKTGTFTLTPTNDAVDETNETITVSGSSGSLTVNSATITLTDDDATPSITLTVNDNSVGEGDGATTITVTATVDGTTRFAAATTVTVSVAGGGTATAVDFAAVSDFDITIAAEAASANNTFTLTPTDDAVDETNETVTVSGSSGGLTVNSATITLTDDDAAPTAITLTVSDNSVAEDDGATTITVTATVDGTTRFAAATTVTVSVGDSGTATAVDFAAVSDFDITIAADAASGTSDFTLTPTNDAVDETNETVTVSGESGSLTVNSATITLTDDDAAPTSITLTVDDDGVGEGDGATTITVTATVDGTTRFAGATTVTVSVAGSGAATAVDFGAVSDFDIAIAAGDASKTGTFTLTPTDDSVDETDETITVSGESGSLTVNSATINLTDDDGMPTSITLTVNDNSVAENDGATTITVKATVNGTTQFAEAKTVTVSVAGSGTATAVDFAAVSSFDIEIAAGAMSEDETFTLTPTDDSVDETDETITVSGTSGTLTVNSATITLTDDDATPSITLTVNDNSVGEGDGATTITVTAAVDGTTRFAAATTVTVSVGGSGTATAVDFAAVSDFDITIAAEGASGASDFTLTPTNDSVDETDETVTVSGSSASLTVNSATITLTDDDAAPTAITLTVNDNSVGEGDGATSITVTATVDGTTRFAAATTVQVSVGGSGTATAVDFAAVSSFDITIAADAASGASDFTLTPTDDTADETDETITVSGTSGGLTVNSATISLTDDDATPTLSINSPSVSEGDSGSTSLTYTVTLSAASGREVTVDYADAGTGTATSGTDYTAITGGTLTFAAGTTSQTFDVSVTGDALDESNETVVVTLSNAENATISAGTGTGTITDDDAAPTSITLTVDDNGVAEGDGATTITVTATVDGTTRFATATTVTVSVAGTGTASAVDFGAVSDFNIEIAAGAESDTGTFTLTPTDDATDETDETVTVSGTSGGLTVNSATISLTDDDPEPSLSLDSPSVTEGNSGSTNLTFTASLSAASAKEVTVDWAGGTGGTATSGTDHAAIAGGTLTFAAGATSRTLAVSVTGDVLAESNETVEVTLSNAGNATIGTATGTGTITDDDAAPTSITLTVDDDRVGEGDGATTITVTATVDGTTRFADSRTVRVRVAGSGAAGAVDFAAVPAFDIEIAAGAASHTGTFTLTPTDNAAIETDETIAVSGASGGLTVNPDTITLTDDDGAPTSIALSVDDNAVGEGDGATTIAVTATPDGAIGFTEDRTVRVSVSGSGAAGVVDFAAVPAFDIEIAAGAASGAGTFTLRPEDDAVDEADEAVTVSGALGGLPVSPATIALIDDDAPPTVSIDSPSVSEGDSGSTDLTFTVTLSAASGKRVTVSWVAGTGGTATSGTDYGVLDTGTLTFEPGETERTIVVSVAGDTVDEADETVQLTLSNSANAVIETRTGTGTIINDDGEAPTLSIDSPSVAEGDDGSASLTYTVTLSAADGRTVTVDYADAGTGTATPGTDYAVLDAGTLAFEPGETGKTIAVSVTGDVLDEADETVAVTLSDAGNATIDTATGTGTITDDDGAPTVSIDSPSVSEGDDGPASLTYTVTLSAASGRTVTVDYADAGTGTATPGTDYAVLGAGTLAFEPGETGKTIAVSVTGDVLDEADETVAVTLSNAGNATIDTATGTGTITDDDGAPTVSIDSPSVSEGDDGPASLTYTVTLSAAGGRTVTVDYADAGTGTATPGTDYAAIGGGTLTFAAGTTSQTIAVSVTGDVLDEADETVAVTLSDAGNAIIGTATGTGTITDDDAAPSLSIDSPSVSEGDAGSASLTYTVTLSAAGGRTVTVDYADAGTGTATPGTDYAVLGAGTLAFEPGETGKTIAVSVTGDTLDEPDETVVLALSGPSNATLETASGVGTIVDDDIDLTPSFGSATIPDQSWTQNRAIAALTLPSATGGDGTLTHELAPALPEGVARDPVTREVSGTPTVSAERTIHTWRARDADGDVAELTFAITVAPDRMPEFADGVAAQRYRVGVPIVDLALPAATGGDGALRYALAPEPPGGLRFDAATRELSGTPTEAMGATEYRLTATDEDGDAAALSFEIEVADPITVSIADARAMEGEPLEFGITLSEPAPEAVTVVWRTIDGTARSPSDYAAPPGGRGELTIGAGRSAAAIVVPTVDDDLAEGEETFTVTLVGASRAELGDGEATGGIVDDDLESTRAEALQWSLAAFGRTVATEAVDAVGRRFRSGGSGARPAPRGWDTPGDWNAPPGGGPGMTGAGWTTGAWSDPAAGGLAGFGPSGGFSGPGGATPGASRTARRPPGTFGPKRSAWDELLSRGAFETSLGATGDDGAEGEQWTLWGRGSISRFGGQSGEALALDGEVRTGHLGVDARLPDRGLLLGVALSHSVGELDYQAPGSGLDGGRVDLDLSSVLPYGHWTPREGVALWGLLGVGWGEVDLTDGFGGATTDTAMRMAALGGRGELASWRGLGLALKGDALVVGMEGSAWARGDLAGLPKVDGNASRLRVMMEGRREWRASERSQLGLSLEFGGRWDGGDADKGMGAELGGGLEYRHTAWGLSASARGRYLLEHSARAFEEWGASLALEFDPGEEGVGASLRLAPTWGEASRGVENLWRNERLPGAGPGGPGAPDGRERWGPGRMEMELGYGFKAGGSRLLRLYGALSGDGPGGGNWRLGGQMTGGRISWSLELDRRENPGGPPRHGILLKFGTGPANGNLYGVPFQGSASPAPLR